MSLDAMKQALEALEEMKAEFRALDLPYGSKAYTKANNSTHALRAAIEQAQEPVAWMYHGIRHDDTPHERPSLIWKPEYMDVMSFEKGAKATPLYTTPPQRQWHGLTDEEINNSYLFWVVDQQDVIGFGKSIETKIKRKNT